MTDFQIMAGTTISDNDTFDVLDILPDGVDQCDVRYATVDDRDYTFAPASLLDKIVDKHGDYLSEEAHMVDCCIYGYVDDDEFYTLDDEAWQAYIDFHFN